MQYHVTTPEVSLTHNKKQQQLQQQFQFCFFIHYLVQQQLDLSYKYLHSKKSFYVSGIQ